MTGVPVSNLQPLRSRKIGGTRFLSSNFGSTAPTDLPPTLGRAFLTMPDQGTTDFCTSYGEAVSNGYKYSIAMSAPYQTAMEGRYLGAPILTGTDAQDSMDATIAFSTLPLIVAPSYDLSRETPAFIADWKNYKDFSTYTRPYFPGIPYKVDGDYDTFDNIRSALHQAYQVDKAVVKVFGHWYESWNVQAMNSDNKGHITTPTDSPITLHRYTIIDWITDASGVPYLVCALTQGDEFGDRGHLYMNRDCCNFVFKDLSNGLGLYISKPAAFDLPTTIAYMRIVLTRLAHV